MQLHFTVLSFKLYMLLVGASLPLHIQVMSDRLFGVTLVKEGGDMDNVGGLTLLKPH